MSGISFLKFHSKPEQDRRQKESKPRRPHRKRVEESTSTLDSGSNVGLTGGGQDVMTVTTRPKALSLKASTLDPRVEALCLDLRVEASNSILGSKPQT